MTQARQSKLPPLHPGEVLREEFMKPLNLTGYSLGKLCGVPRTRLERIAREEVSISADTALRLAAYFRTTPQFWLNLQNRYDVEKARIEIGQDLARIKARELVDA